MVNAFYKFGPPNDMDIEFSGSLQSSKGYTYTECTGRQKLILQLLCHAVYQIQSVKTPGWSIDKTEEISEWIYRNAYVDSNGVVHPGKPVKVTSQMTSAKYQISSQGRLVMTLRESPNIDYLIDLVDLEDDSWVDPVLDYALQHSRRFSPAN